MDEKEFKKTIHNVNELPCVFAKAILRRCGACSRSQKLLLAEREAIACMSPGSQQRCTRILIQLHDKAMFPLHLHHPEQILPHAKELKVQCGGLLGLHHALFGESASVNCVADINALLEDAVEKHGDDLPFEEIIKWITHFEPREKGK